MSIFQNLFGQAPTAQAPAPQAPGGVIDPAAQQAAGNSSQLAGAANNPANSQAGNPNAEGAASPLDNFQELWQNTTKDGEDGSPDPNIPQPLDKEALNNKLGTLQFANITAEDVASITNGGDQAVQTLGKLLNSVGRQASMSAILASEGLLNHHVGLAENRVAAQLPGAIRSHTSKGAVTSDKTLSNLQHPALKPMVDMVTKQFLAKYPDATDQQIADNAREFFTGMASMVTAPNQADNSANQQMPADDWDTWFQPHK